KFAPLLPPSPLSSTSFPYTTLFRSHRSSDRHEGIGQSPWTPPARRAGGSRDGGQAPRLAGFRGAVVDPRAVRRQATENRRCPERSEEHTSELQSRFDLVCRLLLEKK